jgi:hypothetical protein
MKLFSLVVELGKETRLEREAAADKTRRRLKSLKNKKLSG